MPSFEPKIFYPHSNLRNLAIHLRDSAKDKRLNRTEKLELSDLFHAEFRRVWRCVSQKRIICATLRFTRTPLRENKSWTKQGSCK